MIIGVDESGTGALAGPYTVVAAVIDEDQQESLRGLGVTDSKKLTDQKRRQIVRDCIDELRYAFVEVVDVRRINRRGKQDTWRTAVRQAIASATKAAPGARIVVDGKRDIALNAQLGSYGIYPEYVVAADAKVPIVGMASIIAKTARNDLMLELHDHYPEYDWASNYGYGSEKHLKAIDTYGRTAHHREYKNLIGVPFRHTEVVNLHKDEFDVYIGRGQEPEGQFGNPVTIVDECPVCDKHHDHPGDTLPCFRQYFYQRVKNDAEFAKQVSFLQGRRLGCFCKPGPCHGDVIAEYLDADL